MGVTLERWKITVPTRPPKGRKYPAKYSGAVGKEPGDARTTRWGVRNLEHSMKNGPER